MGTTILHYEKWSFLFRQKMASSVAAEEAETHLHE